MQQKSLMKQSFYIHKSEWAAKAVLMASYGYYTQAYYKSAAE